MKNLLGCLILISSGGLFAMSGAGAPAGGVGIDNVVQIEALLLSAGKSYPEIIHQNLTGKKALLTKYSSMYSLEVLSGGVASKSGDFYLVYPLEFGASNNEILRWTPSSRSPADIVESVAYRKSKNPSQVVLRVFKGNDVVSTGDILDSEDKTPIQLQNTVIMVSYGDADPDKDALLAQVKSELEEIREVLRRLNFEAVSRKIAGYPLSDQVAQAKRIKDALKAILE